MFITYQSFTINDDTVKGSYDTSLSRKYETTTPRQWGPLPSLTSLSPSPLEPLPPGLQRTQYRWTTGHRVRRTRCLFCHCVTGMDRWSLDYDRGRFMGSGLNVSGEESETNCRLGVFVPSSRRGKGKGEGVKDRRGETRGEIRLGEREGRSQWWGGRSLVGTGGRGQNC